MINQLDIHKILDQELTFLGLAIVKHAVDLHGEKLLLIVPLGWNFYGDITFEC